MVKTICEVCDKVFEIEKYGGGICPFCKREHFHDNDCYRVVLTKEDKLKLLAKSKVINQERVTEGEGVELDIGAIEVLDRSTDDWEKILSYSEIEPLV